jgi:regulator of sigma E protease
MGALQNIVYFAIFLGVLITVHELGHFLAAKWAGVKVLKFSIGFGPKVFGFRRGETEYQIAALPLGGFVSMAGQYPGEPLDEADQGRTFLGAPWWKRMIILAAGPAFNLIFPVFAYFFAFIGEHQVMAARVGWVEPGYPAAVAGVIPGDLIKKVDGKPIRAFEEIRTSLEGIYDRAVPVTVERDGAELVLQITPQKNEETTQVEKVKRGLLGISAVPQPAIVGVPPGSVGEQAGLRTFDRVLSINGEVVADELKLTKLVDRLSGTLQVVVVRSELREVGGAALVTPKLVSVSLERQPGKGLQALGVESASLYVWSLIPGSPAAEAGLQVGDRLVSMGGVPLTSWFTVQQALKLAERQAFELTWHSGGETKTKQVTQAVRDVLDELKSKSQVLEFGVQPRLAFLKSSADVLGGGAAAEQVLVHMGVVDAFVASVQMVPQAIRMIGLVLGKLLTRQISSDSVGGPGLLFEIAAKSAEAGYEVFLQNMALVSVNLGLVNLLPIPILDGFGLLAAAWEGIRRRPIPVRAREVANLIGFAMLVLLMVLAITNDITRQFR